MAGWQQNLKNKISKDDLEIPLNSQRGIPEEGLVAGGVCIIDEVVAELPFSTYAEVLSEVIPQLRL